MRESCQGAGPANERSGCALAPSQIGEPALLLLLACERVACGSARKRRDSSVIQQCALVEPAACSSQVGADAVVGGELSDELLLALAIEGDELGDGPVRLGARRGCMGRAGV